MIAYHKFILNNVSKDIFMLPRGWMGQIIISCLSRCTTQTPIRHLQWDLCTKSTNKFVQIRFTTYTCKLPLCIQQTLMDSKTSCLHLISRLVQEEVFQSLDVSHTKDNITLLLRHKSLPTPITLEQCLPSEHCSDDYGIIKLFSFVMTICHDPMEIILSIPQTQLQCSGRRRLSSNRDLHTPQEKDLNIMLLL